MKKLIRIILAGTLILLASCALPQEGTTDIKTTKDSSPSADIVESANLSSGAAEEAETTRTDVSAETALQSPAQVYEPNDLLTAEEAAGFVGLPVAIEEGSLFISEDLGYISERYVYDINNTTYHALIEIRQNGLIQEDILKEGQDAEWNFNTEKELSAEAITSISDLGDDAFYFTDTSQVHALYGSYYIVVAFDQDEYDESNDFELNTKIASHMIEKLIDDGN